MANPPSTKTRNINFGGVDVTFDLGLRQRNNITNIAAGVMVGMGGVTPVSQAMNIAAGLATLTNSTGISGPFDPAALSIIGGQVAVQAGVVGSIEQDPIEAMMLGGMAQPLWIDPTSTAANSLSVTSDDGVLGVETNLGPFDVSLDADGVLSVGKGPLSINLDLETGGISLGAEVGGVSGEVGLGNMKDVGKGLRSLGRGLERVLGGK